MIVAGVGFRQQTEADEIVDLVARALADASLAADSLARLATLESLAAEPAYREAARRLGAEPAAIGAEALRQVGAAVRTRSERVLSLHGVGSVAEAAALAGAGRNAQLVLPRIASGRATCALAQGDPA